MKKVMLLCIVVLLLSTVSVWADLIMKQTDDMGTGSSAQSATIYLAPNKMAIVEGENGMIYRADRQILWVYDTQSKVYMEFTPESMKSFMKKTTAMIAQEIESLKKQMQSMPADQKAAMQKAIDEMQLDGTYSFEKLGPERVVNGFSCTPIKVLKNGKESAELCVAPRTKLGMSASETQLLDSLEAFDLNSASGAAPGAFSYPGLDKFLGYKSFPVQEKDSRTGGTETITLTSVQRGSSPAGTYDLPQGLTKQDMFQGQ